MRKALPVGAGYLVAIESPLNHTTGHSADLSIRLFATIRHDGKSGYDDVEKAFVLTDVSAGKTITGKMVSAEKDEAAQIVFKPDNPVSVGHEFEARLTSVGDAKVGTVAETGSLVVKFRTGSMPRVRKVRFVPKMTPDTISYIEVVFSEVMDANSLSAAMSVADGSGIPITGKALTSTSGVMLNLGTEITATKPFTVSLGSESRGASGAFLDGNYSGAPGAPFSVTATPKQLAMINGGFEWAPK